MNAIVIYGAGGFAREVLTVIEDVNRDRPSWEFIGFIDDREAAVGTVLDGFPVLGGKRWLAGRSQMPHVVIGIGAPAVRRKIALRLQELGAKVPVLIHPNAVLSSRVDLAAGTIVTAGNVLTTGIRLGHHVLLNLMCTVGHDCRLGDFVAVAPGTNISGNVSIEEGAEIGTGVKIIQGVTVGGWTVVGAGAVVTRDLPCNCTAVGVPARAIKQREPGWQL